MVSVSLESAVATQHCRLTKSATCCITFLIASIVITLAFFVRPAGAQSIEALHQQLHRPVPGGVAVVPIGKFSTKPEVWLNTDRVLTMQARDGQWWAVVGIPIDTEPGEIALTVSPNQQRGQQPVAPIRIVNVTINPYNYKTQHIQLKNKAMVSPPPETLKRIKTELEQQRAAYATFSDDTPSNLIFDPPVNGRRSSPFGLKRYFNGEPRNPHSGLDFAVPTGTPVKSPANGKVLMIGDLYFNGLTVFVDHGQGVISMFCHLSRIDLLPGDTVKRGDVVGLVGNTGRSTGPHLHWNVSLNNARVDPALFLRR